MKPIMSSLLLSITAIASLIVIAMRICFLDYHLAGIHHAEECVALLGLSYLAHILLKLNLHGYKDANNFLWFTRAVILTLSLVPIWKTIQFPTELTIQQATLLTLETIIPIGLLSFIEGLVMVFCYIILKKKKEQKRRANKKSTTMPRPKIG